MPSPYIVRSFAENCYYHVFNRGLDKREIFKDPSDYKIFKYYLFIYTAPLKRVLSFYPQLKPRLQNNNLSNELDLIAYCLMPNHIHLLIHQKTKSGVSKFMKQVSNAYTKYFNTKYERRGNLMESRFKAVQITSESLLAHVSRYIHLNPVVANIVKNTEMYPWSSYKSYILDNQKESKVICEKEIILNQFKTIKDYKNFVQGQIEYAKVLAQIKHLTIEN